MMLSDEEIKEIKSDFAIPLYADEAYEFARAIERAVLAKASQQVQGDYDNQLLSMGMDQAVSMYRAVNKLIEAADILLNKKNYDGTGHELITEAKNQAASYLRSFRPAPTPKQEPVGPKLIERYDQLELGRHYWVKSKHFGTVEIEHCRYKGEMYSPDPKLPTHLGNQWCTEDSHNYLFENWEIFGPVPTMDELQRVPAQAAAIPECFSRLLFHAGGMRCGNDWNNGTAAKHHREKLCQATIDCENYISAAPKPEIQSPIEIHITNEDA